MKFMRYTLAIAVIYMIASVSSAQTQVCPGDTVCLTIGSFYGNIQWQESADNISWSDISGANSDTSCVVVSDTTYYRAVVTDNSCDPYYSDTSLILTYPVGGTQTFLFSGQVDTFIVPPCVDSLFVDISGAQGGTGPVGCSSNTSSPGGLGGRVQATIPVSEGDTLFITVGGKGEDDNNTSAAGGYNGGGDTGFDNTYTYYGGGGGGGASDIRTGGTTLNDRIIVAGGGGGAGADGCNCNDLYGGAGGDLTGGSGEPGQLCSCNPSGSGGTQSSGGAKGDWGCSCNATDGGFGYGGMSNTTSCGGPTGAGGGGGGWYGGGGGGLGGGGGGSSYTFPSATNITHTQGYKNGNGEITISW